MTAVRKPTEPWDCEWAAELAGEALAYLARYYPERALLEGIGAWADLMRQYGWEDGEIDEELDWAAIVNERCELSGLEDFQLMQDQINYVESDGSWRGYPGPGRWSDGGEGES